MIILFELLVTGRLAAAPATHILIFTGLVEEVLAFFLTICAPQPYRDREASPVSTSYAASDADRFLHEDFPIILGFAGMIPLLTAIAVVNSAATTKA
jgi:hypothetical protein